MTAKQMALKRWGRKGTPERQAAAEHQASKLSAHWATMTPEERSARMKAVRRKGLARKLIDAADAAVAEGIDAEIGSK